MKKEIENQLTLEFQKSTLHTTHIIVIYITYWS